MTCGQKTLFHYIPIPYLNQSDLAIYWLFTCIYLPSNLPSSLPTYIITTYIIINLPMLLTYIHNHHIHYQPTYAPYLHT
jgi:hypothetical protein